jgi:hypothetical protein
MRFLQSFVYPVQLLWLNVEVGWLEDGLNSIMGANYFVWFEISVKKG